MYTYIFWHMWISTLISKMQGGFQSFISSVFSLTKWCHYFGLRAQNVSHFQLLFLFSAPHLIRQQPC